MSNAQRLEFAAETILGIVLPLGKVNELGRRSLTVR